MSTPRNGENRDPLGREKVPSWRPAGAPAWYYSPVDHAERYFQLLLLGRDEFLQVVAPAALIRQGSGEPAPRRPRAGSAAEADEGDTLVASLDGGIAGFGPAAENMEVYPLAKKQGAAFADMITLGRTANNDVVLDDITVSRFHAFLRELDGAWIVCDAGSKNGTRLDGAQLDPRVETAIRPGASLELGDIELAFYPASDLFDVLGGTGGTRV